MERVVTIPMRSSRGFASAKIPAAPNRAKANLIDNGSGFNDALAVPAKGKRVFAAGFGNLENDDMFAFDREWVVRAYRAANGVRSQDHRGLVASPCVDHIITRY